MNMDDPRSFVGHLSDPAAELRAAFFAAKAHGSQRYGNGSYTDHLFDVRQVMWDHRIGGAPAVAALLHDTIEDTDTTREDIAKLFGDYTAALVWAVSGMPKDTPRRVRKADAYAKICAMPAAIVVIAGGPDRQRRELRAGEEVRPLRDVQERAGGVRGVAPRHQGGRALPGDGLASPSALREGKRWLSLVRRVSSWREVEQTVRQWLG